MLIVNCLESCTTSHILPCLRHRACVCALCVHRRAFHTRGFRLLHVQLPSEVCCILIHPFFPRGFHRPADAQVSQEIYMWVVFWVEK